MKFFSAAKDAHAPTSALGIAGQGIAGQGSPLGVSDMEF